MLNKLFPILLCIFLFDPNLSAQNIAPKIIKTIPEFADCNVDPAITEIIVEFDQDMSEGYSIPDRMNLPLITGPAQWINKRTVSIPVKLHPGKTYSLIFNSQRFQGFKNTLGIPLNPVELHFLTKNVTYADLNKKAYDELVNIFPLKYSYSSLKGIKWSEMLEKSRPELFNATSQAEFGFKLIKLLKSAGDMHLLVEFEDQKYSTFLPGIITQNYNFTKLFERLQNKFYTKTLNCVAGEIDSIGYISFRAWDSEINNLSFFTWPNSATTMIPVSDVFSKILKYPYLIVDIRENSGGNEEFARQFASLFIDDSVAFEKAKIFNESSEKYDNEIIKWLVPDKNKLDYTGKIIVFSGPGVMSSNESFLLMMKQVPNARIVGTTSFGSSGNPVPYELSNGVVVFIPSWQAYSMDGKLIEGNGIRPDIEVVIPQENFQTKDALLEKVVWGIKNGKY